jgi:arsenate reductase
VRALASTIRQSPIDNCEYIEQDRRIDSCGSYQEDGVARARLALDAADIDAATELYSKLICAGPAERRAGYAKFAIGQPSMSTSSSGRPPRFAREAQVAEDEAVLWRRLLAELLGSALLASVVIGSGIAAQQLSPGAVGLELLENAAATAAGLYVIILMFGPVSGAHFNPVVSFVDAAFGGLGWRHAWAYLPAQVTGCTAGAIVSNLMFSKAAISISAHHRATPAHFGSEVLATLGLVLVIFALARSGRGHVAPAAVGAYIGAAYFFTSSTSFANPAIAVGRMFSNTFAGIAPSSVPAFAGAEVIGGALAFAVIRALYPGVTAAEAADIVLPHHHLPEAGTPGDGAAGTPGDGAAGTGNGTQDRSPAPGTAADGPAPDGTAQRSQENQPLPPTR